MITLFHNHRYSAAVPRRRRTMGYRTERRRQAESAMLPQNSIQLVEVDRQAVNIAPSSTYQISASHTRHQNAVQAARNQRVHPVPKAQQAVKTRAITKSEGPNGVRTSQSKKEPKILHHICELDTGNIQRMQEGTPEIQSDKLGEWAAKPTIRHGGPRDSQKGWQMV